MATGIVEVSRFLQGQSVDYLGVANAEEGVLLRQAGLEIPIHVFTLPAGTQISAFTSYDLEPTVCTGHEARLLNSQAQRSKKTVQVHIKIDTGMNRIGVGPRDLARFLRLLGSLRQLEIKGVYTHFAMADKRDKTFSRRQLELFHQALHTLQACGVSLGLVHCAGSAGILDLPESYFSMVRPGIMLVRILSFVRDY